MTGLTFTEAFRACRTATAASTASRTAPVSLSRLVPGGAACSRASSCVAVRRPE